MARLAGFSSPQPAALVWKLAYCHVWLKLFFILTVLLRRFLCFPFEVLKSGFLTFGDSDYFFFS